MCFFTFGGVCGGCKETVIRDVVLWVGGGGGWVSEINGQSDFRLRAGWNIPQAEI